MTSPTSTSPAPAGREHQPLSYRWPPLRCRCGWHRWRRRDVVTRRPAPHPAPAGRELCSCISNCARCDVVRHEQNVPPPRRRWRWRS